MPFASPSPASPPWRPPVAAWRAVAVLLVGVLTFQVSAAPETEAANPMGEDRILRLLQDKGLWQGSWSSQTSPLMEQVRQSASDMILTAMNFLGVPYRRGGSTSEEGFDCSGFTRFVFENSLGLVLPRRSDEQAKDAGLLKITKEQLRPGDLVFFNTMRRTFSHVGIYLGDGRFIHAPKPGAEVRIEDMRQAYWTQRFTGARRASPLDESRVGAAQPTGFTGAASPDAQRRTP